jgi:type II secretory pathway pseudopilin PulG
MERGARMERRGRARLDDRCWPRRTRPNGPSSEGGLTLIELVIAISVFAVMAGGIASTASSGLNLIRNDRNRSVAANLASQEMDEIRQTDFGSLPLSGLTTASKLVDGVSYDVERQFDFVATTATTSPCDSVGGVPKLLRATVKVRWNSMGSIPPVQSNTVITPPVGAFDPNLGHVAVKISDRDPGVLPENISAVPVYLTGMSVNRTLYTTAEGCAFFDHLAVGTYTVQLGQPGSVDRQGVGNPTQTAGVTAGAITAVGFDYDQAGTIDATLTAAGGGTLPASTWSQIPVVLGNTAFLPSGTKVFSGTGTFRTLASLFPSTTGYTAVAGDCADADNGVSEVSVTPNGTTAATIPLASVRIIYAEAGNDGPDIIRASNEDAGCSLTNLDVGTAATSSEILLIALPYGTWTISVPGHTVAGSPVSVTLDPSGPSVVDVLVTVT